MRVHADGSVTATATASHRPGMRIRDALLAFHARHYAASRMRLVVLGKQSCAPRSAPRSHAEVRSVRLTHPCSACAVDSLEELVAPLFSPVPDTAPPPPPPPAAVPYGPEQLQRHFKVVPVCNVRMLSLQWPLPSLIPLCARSRRYRADIAPRSRRDRACSSASFGEELCG